MVVSPAAVVLTQVPTDLGVWRERLSFGPLRGSVRHSPDGVATT